MTMQTALAQMINFRSDMDNQSHETVTSTIAAWRKVIRSQNLKREEFALSATLDALINALHCHDLTLAYMYQGKLYATHKSFRNECKGGVMSTEYLHSLGLTMAEWDKLPKYHVWVNTGKVFAPCA